MVSLSMEQEPMLPTIASEKAPLDGEKQQNPISYVSPRSTKMDMFKKLVVAISLMMMGASVLKIAQKNSHHHHHRHNSLPSSAVMNHLEHHGPGGPPHHDFPHPPPPPPPHGPGPHGHGPSRPRPVDCFVLDGEKSLNFNMTVRGPVTNLFLDRSLGDASIDIERSFDSKPELNADGILDLMSVEVSPHHGDQPGSPPPPHRGPPGPPHHGPPHRSSTVQVRVKSLDSDLTEKTNETYVCSLALPCGKRGLGLFPEDITKHNKGREEHDMKEPMEPKPIGPIAIKLTIPQGPFSLTHGPPPHHFFHGHHGHHPHGPHGPHGPHHPQGPHGPHGPRKALKSVLDFFKGKKPCSKKHSVPA